MATTSSNKVTGIIYGVQQASPVRLSNAGYITVRAPPQVMNRLNEFGMYSKNFSFSPGFGMPGRAYLSRIPSWESNLSFLKPDQFARVGGAKIYGVNTSLCIPIFTPIGTMAVALYSTQNLSRDKALERKYIEHFWKLKPEPKWKLTIDVGLKIDRNDAQEMPVERAPDSSPRMATAKNQAFVIPPSPTNINKTHLTIQPDLSVEDKKPVATLPPVQYSCNEQSLALLIEKYMPLDRDYSATMTLNPTTSRCGVAGNLMSLRLILLRHSSCRTNTESKMVDIIMGKYQSYLCTTRREHDLILSITNDWKQLVMLSSSISEVQSRATSYNARPAVIRHNSCSSNNSIPPMSLLNTSPMTSSTPSSFIPGAPAPDSSLKPMMSSNQFGDNLQNTTNSNVATSVMEYPGSHHQAEEQNNVPRVVSEQGPIG